MPLLMCPNDETAMQEISREGVLIDICPKCRGVWLDRGELEKLMEQLHIPNDANVHYERNMRPSERGKPYKRKRPSLMDFFD